MSTLETEQSPSPQRLLQEVALLSTADLDRFLDQALTLRAVRHAPHLSQEETQLLEKINTGLPEATWQRYDLLHDKRRDGSLTPDEHQELLRLVDVVEIDNAQRIGYLIELARLRQTTLDALMQSLGIGPRRRV
jgi:hypothetical protein